MPIVYLALGSNLGDRSAYLHKALKRLQANHIKILKVSTIIETEPVGGPKQDNFLNAVIKGETSFSPESLQQITQAIERRLGRIKKSLNGPRVIDIDILLYDEIKLVTANLIIPHPRMFERDFVMTPLKEIAPELCALLSPLKF